MKQAVFFFSNDITLTKIWYNIKSIRVLNHATESDILICWQTNPQANAWNYVCKCLKLCMQTDLEEGKAQEISKLQNSLQEMQKKVEESNAQLVKEREAAKKAIEDAPPVVQETQVVVEDTEKINSLTAEVEKLKVRGFYPARSACEMQFSYLLTQQTGVLVSVSISSLTINF